MAFSMPVFKLKKTRLRLALGWKSQGPNLRLLLVEVTCHGISKSPVTNFNVQKSHSIHPKAPKSLPWAPSRSEVHGFDVGLATSRSPSVRCRSHRSHLFLMPRLPSRSIGRSPWVRCRSGPSHLFLIPLRPRPRSQDQLVDCGQVTGEQILNPLDPWSQSWTPQSIHECFTDLQQLFQTLERFQARWELQEPSCMDQLANRLCQWLHKGLWLEPTLRCCGTPQPNFENPMPHIVRQVAKLWAHKGHSKCGWGRPPVLRVSQLMEVQMPIVPLFLEIHLRIFRVVGADDVASRFQIGAEELPPQVVD